MADRTDIAVATEQVMFEARAITQARDVAWASTRDTAKHAVIERVLVDLRERVSGQLAGAVLVPCTQFPLLAYAGVAGDEEGAVALAAAMSLLWASDHLYERMFSRKGRDAQVRQSPELATAGLLATVAHLALAELDAPPVRRVALQQTVAHGLLRARAARERHAELTHVLPATRDEVEEVVTAASGELGAMYARAGAQLAGATTELTTIYADLGLALGVVVQAISEYRAAFNSDAQAHSQAFSGPLPTLPVALYLQSCDASERRTFLRLCARAGSDIAADARLSALLAAAEVPARCVEILDMHSQRALDILAEADPREPARRQLEAAIDAMMLQAQF